MLLKELKHAVLALLWLTLLTGLAYPLLVTGIAQVAFPRQANGSVILRDGKPIGSELIGQPFAAPDVFWSRLSATARVPYDAAASSGSNRAPTNPALVAAAQARIAALRAAGADDKTPIPQDLVTASGSGLDPHISPAAALWQVPRVARARGRDEARVRKLVDEHTRCREFGLLGEPRVNVLELNLALAALR
jgi:K+-transporting ATPase ATPase C chain